MKLLPALASYLLLATLCAAATDPLEIGIFGIGACHTRSRSAADSATWIPQMESIGVRYLRSGMTSWQAVQNKEGTFDFATLDAQLDYLDQHGIVYGGLLLGNRGGKGLPVQNLEGWSTYVTEIVSHTQNRIKRWEVWNEPPNFTDKGQTPADYAKIVVAAYDAAKKVDPTCAIGLAAKSVHINYLEQVIKSGAKDHFDYITLHPYEVLGGVEKNRGSEAIFMNIVPCLRKMLAAQNPAKKDVPVIFTELGADAKHSGNDGQAHALVKAYTLSLAQGVACVQWFEGRDGDSGPMGLIDQKGTTRPAYTALGEMIKHLGQKPKYLGWVLLNDKHYSFAFQGAKGPVLVAWSYRKATDQLVLPQPRTVVDPLTGEASQTASVALTAAPVFVLDPPADLLQKAKVNLSKPLPWGGDFTKAESVSVTYGADQVESGLHTLSGDAVAQAVVAYGGPAREGGVPGGNLFIVDPGFLSYTPTPIEITAVVRRNEANDNSGFKLVYESTTGFKNPKAGWYTVPDNKQWHTVKWRIDDAQFVNYWGYNFALESDGSKFSKYYLQSVTVTKLAK